MKPIWERYERREKDERLTGFWILLSAMIIAVLGTIFYNIACLVFVIVFGLFAMVFLQGYARPRIGRMLDDCKRAHKAELEYRADKKEMYWQFLLFCSPYYFAWQLCSLLLVVGIFWENPVVLWFMTSFPALFISTVILIPWREKWIDLGGKHGEYWRMHIWVYLSTLGVAALVLGAVILFFGVNPFLS